MIVITTEKIPIKSWCQSPEEGALVQARNLANLPFLAGPVALNPPVFNLNPFKVNDVVPPRVVVPVAFKLDVNVYV